MVPCSHTVIVCVDRWGGTPEKHGALTVVSSRFLRCIAHTVVTCMHTVVVCVVGGGGPLRNTGLEQLFSSSFLRCMYPDSGSA